MDRCALFVDASYVLADGAMAVHGTRRRQSVSWDYRGLLQLLSNLSMERTGLPLLRCYWYESAADGQRAAEQEALADMPGVKLRLAGPGDGVEGILRRDLTTLARNQAVSDAMVVSSAEELTRVVADVQDHGMRVTLLHLAADGNWTISRTLRRECDDVIEISPAHLRPYVELIPGAEPPRVDERDEPRPYTNGHVPGGQTTGYAPLPPESSNGHHYQAPAAPAFADYQRSGYQRSDYQRPDQQRPDNQRPVPRLSPPAPGDQPPAAPAAPAAATPPAPAAAPAPPAPPVEAPAPAPVSPAAGGDLLAGLAAMPVKRPDVPDVPDAGTAPPEPPPAAAAGPPAPQAVPHEPTPFSDPAPFSGPTAGPAKRAASRPASISGPMSRPASFTPASELPTRREFSAYQNLFAAPVSEVPPPPALALPPVAAPAPAPVSAPAPAPAPVSTPAPAPTPLPEPASAPEPAPMAPSAAPAPAPVPPTPVSAAPAPVRPEPAPASAAPMRPEPAQPEPAVPVAGPPLREERQARPYPADLSGYTPGGLRDPFLAEAEADSGSQPVMAAYPDPANQLPGYPASGGYPAVPQSPAAQPPLAQPPAAQPSAAQPQAAQPPAVQPQAAQSPGQDAPAYLTGHSNGFSGHSNGSTSGPQPAVSLRQPGTDATPVRDSQPPMTPPRVPGGQTVALGRPVIPSGATSAPEADAPAPVPEFAHPGYGDGASQAGTRTAGFFGADPLGMPTPSATGPSTGDILVPVDAAAAGNAYADPGVPESPGAPSNPGQPVNGNASGVPVNVGVPASNGHASGATLQSVPAIPQPAAPQPAISLADAVQSAHEEGQEFGGSVARDAPTLWLEAVLARKPRMPSDLEARLLQGSSLPIDFLLHDEVRHALRRGFWDALERARR